MAGAADQGRIVCVVSGIGSVLSTEERNAVLLVGKLGLSDAARESGRSRGELERLVESARRKAQRARTLGESGRDREVRVVEVRCDCGIMFTPRIKGEELCPACREAVGASAGAARARPRPGARRAMREVSRERERLAARRAPAVESNGGGGYVPVLRQDDDEPAERSVADAALDAAGVEREPEYGADEPGSVPAAGTEEGGPAVPEPDVARTSQPPAAPPPPEFAGEPEPPAREHPLTMRGHERRVRVLRLLRVRGPMVGVEIQQATGLSPAQVSEALQRLARDGWVEEGRWRPAEGDRRGGKPYRALRSRAGGTPTGRR
jgi:DNA-binding transcriptional ArsR family regulator